MGWRRGTPCPSGRWRTSRADSYHRRCRRTPSSPRSPGRPPASEGASWAAASSRAACRPSTHWRCVAAESRSRSRGSAWSERAGLRPRTPRPRPTWVWSPPPPPSSACLTGRPGRPGCWRTAGNACCGPRAEWARRIRPPRFCPWRRGCTGAPCPRRMLSETDLQGGEDLMNNNNISQRENDYKENVWQRCHYRHSISASISYFFPLFLSLLRLNHFPTQVSLCLEEQIRENNYLASKTWTSFSMWCTVTEPCICCWKCLYQTLGKCPPAHMVCQTHSKRTVSGQDEQTQTTTTENEKTLECIAFKKAKTLTSAVGAGERGINERQKKKTH